MNIGIILGSKPSFFVVFNTYLLIFAVVLRTISEKWSVDKFPVIVILRFFSRGIVCLVLCILPNKEPLLVS